MALYQWGTGGHVPTHEDGEVGTEYQNVIRIDLFMHISFPLDSAVHRYITIGLNYLQCSIKKTKFSSRLTSLFGLSSAFP